MNDNRNHIGSNWRGGTPRTMDEAFPHRARGWGNRPTLSEKIRDTLMIAAFVAFLWAVAVIGPAFFSPGA